LGQINSMWREGQKQILNLRIDVNHSREKECEGFSRTSRTDADHVSA
jgi:hypothetical protein